MSKRKGRGVDKVTLEYETGLGRRKGWYWIPVVGYAGVIFYLSSLSHPEETLPAFLEVFGDRVLHGLEYSLLGILCYRAFRYAAGPWAVSYALLLAVVTATLYGVTDELHQSLVPERVPEGLDLLADAIGATVGAWGWHRFAQARAGSQV